MASYGAMFMTPEGAPTRSRFRFLRRGMFVAAGATLLPVLAMAARQTPQRATPPVPMQSAPGDQSAVARGEYLATEVAMCVQCHSGRDRDGNILESEKFRGAAMPVHSPYPNKEWAVRTPALAGLPGFTNEQIIMLLTEGHAGEGRQPPRPPMPPFRMNRQDAEAIVAFLRSR